MQLTRLLRSAIKVNPEKIISECQGRKLKWAEFGERVSRLAGAMKKLGIKSGDRVAMLSLNSDRYIEYYFAVWWAGAAVVPMNTRWSEAENIYSLNDSGSKMLFVDDNFLPNVNDFRSKVEELETVIYIGNGESPQDVYSYESLIESSDPVQDALSGGEDLAGLFYTGGTTGFPKGVMLPHRALCFNALIAAKHFCFDENTCYLHVAPMFHLADLVSMLGMIVVRGSHVFMSRFDPVKILDVIENNKVTYALLVPTMIAMMLQQPGFDSKKLINLKHIGYGASPMPEGVMRDAMNNMPNVRFVQAYGQTEMAPLVTILSPEYHVFEGANSGKLLSAGQAAFGVEVMIMDATDNILPRGEVGEIVTSSPGVMLGYWKQQEQTDSVLKNSLLHTGDAAYMDEDGFVFIVDRMKDMIVSGGENIFCAEVENAISTFPDVLEVAVFGIPSEEWGEAVHAVVVVGKNIKLLEQEIIMHCQSQIALYKSPRSIDFRETPLPLSAAGKILKRQLKEPFWQDQNRSIG